MVSNMNDKNSINKPSAFKLFLKGIVLINMIWILVIFMIYTVSYVAEGDPYEEDMAYIVDHCNGYYYERQYGELYEYLVLYDAYSEEYDMYWECVNGYIDYIEYVKWKAVPEERMSDSEAMSEQYRRKVLDNADNCQFEQNKQQLNKYAEMVKTVQ